VRRLTAFAFFWISYILLCALIAIAMIVVVIKWG
jgi:hypothetical protein